MKKILMSASNPLKVKEIIKRASSTTLSVEFSVSDLFSQEEWKSFDRYSHQSAGKAFFIAVIKGQNDDMKDITFRRKTRCAFYIKTSSV